MWTRNFILLSCLLLLLIPTVSGTLSIFLKPQKSVQGVSSQKIDMQNKLLPSPTVYFTSKKIDVKKTEVSAVPFTPTPTIYQMEKEMVPSPTKELTPTPTIFLISPTKAEPTAVPTVLPTSTPTQPISQITPDPIPTSAQSSSIKILPDTSSAIIIEN